MSLIERKQWILHQNKIPTNPATLKPHDPHDPSFWRTYQEALTLSQLYPTLELGVVLTGSDPYWCLDIDHAYDHRTQQWSPLAHELMRITAGCLIEVSRSGTGLHIWGAGELPDDRKCKNTKLKIELYSNERFIAWTGNTSPNGSMDYQPDMRYLVETYFPDVIGANIESQWIDEPAGVIPDDDELMNRMFRSTSAKAAFSGVSIKDLWHQTDNAKEYYNNDLSSMDMALANHLAFWTNRNPVRMERLFNQSALATRDKWVKREKYRKTTILEACIKCEKSIGEGVTPDEPAIVVYDDVPQVRAGYQYLAHTEQPAYFKGCVYINELHAILTPRGQLLRPEKFKSSYGGYIFALDSEAKKTTKNAFEVFTESQAYHFPKADRMAFRPDMPAGKVYEEGGYVQANAYVPIQTPRHPGDPTPFLNHLKTMLPNGRDAEIILCYMAACVQHIGVKFQWVPLIQGAEGNGKTMFFRIMQAILGQRYVSLPKPTQLANKFNGWIENKLFFFIDEIRVPNHRGEILEALKPIVTNESIEIERKGQDPYVGDNRANGMMGTNYKDAIPMNTDKRRYAIFFTAQQDKHDIIRVGWNALYFRQLYNWLRAEGYAILHEYLATYVIPDELNPATGCQTAPRTTSTDEAIEYTLGTVEQEIVEAIESGRYGFCGGMVSGNQLDDLLEEKRLAHRLPRNKRREVMITLGYDWHPSTINDKGRSCRPIDTEGNKRVVIYCKKDSFENLTRVEVTNEYVRLQTESRKAVWAVVS